VLWRSDIAAPSHFALIVEVMKIDSTGMLHIVGSTTGNLTGNVLLGEQDGFIAKIDAETGVVK